MDQRGYTRNFNPWDHIFEPELALLVGLQVVSSKGEEREEEEEGELFDKILLALASSVSLLFGSQG